MQHVCACYRREESEKPDEFETFGTPLTPIVVEHPGQFDEEMFGAILGSTLAEDIASSRHGVKAARPFIGLILLIG